MVAFIMSIIGLALFIMGDLYVYQDYLSQPQLTVNIVAIQSLIALENAAEVYCNTGCAGGAIPVAPAVPFTGGTFGAMNFNGQIITYFSSATAGAESGVLDPALIPNVAAQSVAGRFYAGSNQIIGISGMLLSTGQQVGPTVQCLAPGSGIPDGAIVMRNGLTNVGAGCA